MGTVLKIAYVSKLSRKIAHGATERWTQCRSTSKLYNPEEITKIRNFGVIAHIDAGKTTTTERMLFYSGFTNSMGEVHEGNTVMDYMAQERERGITITSAAITFNWRKHKLNLLDTPGHVDFTFEVERSLSVLDGAVVILDASAGVEVQTLKVWEQATRYNVPCVIYLNKMDKPAANIDLCLESIKKKLKVEPLLLHSPIGGGKDFHGIVDLVTFQKHVWNRDSKNDDGRKFITENLNIKSNDSSLMHLLQKREEIIESIADLDDVIAEKYITEGTVDGMSTLDLMSALRRITHKRAAIPVLCGSSYKNVGVQLLMDAIINYLPNPTESTSIFGNSMSDDLCMLVFKIIHNKTKEPLTFLRVYSGSVKSGQKIYNQNREVSEKIPKLLIPLADDFEEVAALSAGNIGVAAGLKETVTGDLLFNSASSAGKWTAKNSDANLAVGSSLIQVPDPVFFCTIEPPSVGLQKKLDIALLCLQREDPTFQVEIDETMGQTVIMGMGELHIDIIKERIRVEYNIDAYTGPLQVAYREALDDVVENTQILNKIVAGTKQFAKITLRAYPSSKGIQKQVNVLVTKENDLGKVRQDYLKAITSGVKSALNSGPLLSFPVTNVGVDLLWLEVGKGTSLAMLSAVASQCLTGAFRKTKLHLLEPIMKVCIVSDKGYAGPVLTDLSQRRSQILNMERRQDVELIEAFTPLSELRGYSSQLRALTCGTCSLTIEFEKYQKMDSNEQLKTIEEVTGFTAF